MVGLCEGGNEPPGYLKAKVEKFKYLGATRERFDPELRFFSDILTNTFFISGKLLNFIIKCHTANAPFDRDVLSLGNAALL
ncbi:hypothetical protein ANN_05710 [Periplaneta americana]|uniref:Uncharacterized protein n=1 Tax=Periplaneta americana TaxID=6978 RepID=A0ABQ8TBJ5_PERAM|nr:hypothetical protein ANN_05710 [Periplaneta americana]